MTEIELMLKKDREKLLQLYTRANTKSKISLLAADMISHSYLCETLGINLDDDEWFCSSRLVNLVKNIGLDIASLFMSETKTNRDFYDRIFFETFNKFVGMSFRSYDYYYGMFKFKKMSKKDLMELIFDFLNTYDSILVKRFKSMLDNSQIIFTDKTWGEIRFFSSLNKNLIS